MDNDRMTEVSVFRICWLKNAPTSVTVGNGLCAVPGAFRIQPVRLNDTSQKHGTRASLGGSWLAWASLMRAAGQRETMYKQWANP